MDQTPKSDLPSGTDTPQKALTLDGTRVRLYEGRVLAGRYRVLERLGRGEMGEVWHAYDIKLRVDVALKSVRRSTRDAVEALRREVRTAREVISPNVCRIFDLVVEEDQEFVSMEYIDGQTLLSLLLEKSPLELRQAQDIALQFLAGLEAIHQANLVHRDLKPENIMITRTNRVVVMDFGIAKPIAQISGTISGTPPYMPPEQLAGGKVDPRSDVFAAGAVLAEMIHAIPAHRSREAVWNAIREDPPQLPDSPWQTAIARAVARNPGDRFPSAGALARALEEVTQRIKTVEERKPYPGLSSFTENDSQYFFGRELEVETIIKKLQEMHLIAIIGPSGAGKTSFLHAGLIRALPSGWSHAFTQPGDSPLGNLGQTLAAEFSGDTEAIRKMVRLEDIDSALWLLHRWRQKYAEALLVVDRFEELFTLNDRQTQTFFTSLLGRAVLEADIHILLVMRDDFLIFCKEHAALAPIFSEITALLPLSGNDLRRALIQPALQCGYRLEDEALIDEILSDIDKERGALPLMAFAAARLWERRDRKAGQLTRAAYQEIGRVGGALAQHAEATMERIGSERQGIVREIFRNLVTAQNTRAARDTEEILSVFENRQAAEEVLRTLIDARLLTSFEAATNEAEETKRRVEIIHESLISAWPRLVRWQTQDTDSSQFRDQLRQAAHVWQERGRPVELLWTGASYKEFELWSERYPGGLTSTEKAFSDAMLQHARQRRLRRHVFLTATFVILVGILAVIASLWTREKTARQQAVSETRRAEASKLLALGRSELDHDPTVALAYAIASVEHADSPIARRFAMQALWKGPPAFISEMPVRPTFLNFSRNGKWLAAGGYLGARLLPQDGKQATVLAEGLSKLRWWNAPQFSPNDDYVVWASTNDLSIVKVWSILQGKEVQQLKMEGATACLVRGPYLILITDLAGTTVEEYQWERCRIRIWSFDKNEPEIVGQWNLKNSSGFDVSNDAKRLAYGRGRSVYVRAVEGFEDAPETLVGEHAAEITRVIFHPNGKQIASADTAGEIRMWSLLQDSKVPVRTIPPRGIAWRRNTNAVHITFGDTGNIFYSPSGSRFAATYPDKTLCVWDMNGAAEADPLILRRNLAPSYPYIVFDPSDRWAVVNYSDTLASWPLMDVYPYVLHGKGDLGAFGLSFTDDGKYLAAAFGHGSIRLWEVDNRQMPGRDLWKPVNSEMFVMDADPTGKYLAVGTSRAGFVISIADGSERKMPGIGIGAASFSANGRLLAAESYGDIPLWNLESNEFRVLKGNMKNYRVRFSGENLFSSDTSGNLYKWDLKNETSTLFAKGSKPLPEIAVPRKAPHLLLCLWKDLEEVDLREFTSELRIFNLRTGESYPIQTHGNRVNSAAVDPSGTVLVTGDVDGIVRVGPITGEEPHLLFGHQCVSAVAVDHNRQWIASSDCQSSVVRLWPMPKGKPLHILPYDPLLKRLRALTNVRVAADEKSSTGYRIQFDPFPGWEKAPTWE